MEAFADYERRSKDGRQTQHTVGAVFGVDRSTKLGDGDVRLGLIGGYAVTQQHAESAITRRQSIVYDIDPDFAGGVAFDFDLRIPNVLNRTETDLRRRIKSVNGGLTGSYAIGRFFVDAVARIESSDLSQRGTQLDSAGSLADGLGELRIIDNNNTRNNPITQDIELVPVYNANGDEITSRLGQPFGCIFVSALPDGAQNTGQRASLIQQRIDALNFQQTITPLDGSATSISFILANTMGVTYELGNGFIFEPTVGYRYIYTDYSRSAAALGLDDGRALRLEAGGKISHINVSRDGAVWINSVGLYAYSDVMVKGFVIASDGSAVDSDEGEIRGRAVLQSRLQMPNGVSYYGEVNGRFGDQYWGVGGKLGMRIEW